MKLLKISICLVAFIALFSCEKKENPSSKKGEIVLSFQKHGNTLKSTAVDTESEPAYLVISVQELNGKSVYSLEKIELLKFNDEYLSQPIELTEGNYKLTAFMVLDKLGNTIYAAPLKDSEKAYLVDYPLPLEFSISVDKVTKLNPEVLSTKNQTASSFGYLTSSFSVLKTFDFLVSIFVYNEETKNLELTTAQLEVVCDSGNYLFSLGSITNQITVRDGFSTYNLIIKKTGYESQSVELQKDELKAAFNSPLKIVLVKSDIDVSKGLIAYYPFNGNANDVSGNGNNGVVYGASLCKDKFGAENQAYHFDGVNDFIEIIPQLETLITDFSISISYKNEGFQGQIPYDRQYLFDGHAGYKNAYSFFEQGFFLFLDTETGSQKAFSGILYSKNDFYDRYLNSTSCTSNEWHTIVFIRKGTVLSMYYDNKLINNVEGNSSSQGLNMAHPWYIGTFCGNNPNYHAINYSFKGIIDDVRIYNRALEANEIDYISKQ